MLPRVPASNSQFNPNAAEFHPGGRYENSCEIPRQSYPPARNFESPRGGIPDHPSDDGHSRNWNNQYGNHDYGRTYRQNCQGNQSSVKKKNTYNPNAPRQRISSAHCAPAGSLLDESSRASYVDAMAKLSELRNAGMLTTVEDQYYREGLLSRIANCPSYNIFELVRPKIPNQNIKYVPNISNHNQRTPNQQINRKRNHSVLSVDRSEPSIERSQMNNLRLLNHNNEEERIMDKCIRPVMVHCALVDNDSSLKPKNLTIICKDGDVKANKDVLRNASAYFHQMISDTSDSLTIFDHEAHMTKMVVELVTKGRVVILKGRLNKFMKALNKFRVSGVFHSEPDECEEDSLINLSNTGSMISTGDGNAKHYYTKLPQLPFVKDKVRCHSCNNIILEGTFADHYKEYHMVLEKTIRCCKKLFTTKYAHVQHSKLDCKRHRNEISTDPNISAIADNEQPGVAVNLNAERPDSNAHSTPIDD